MKGTGALLLVSAGSRPADLEVVIGIVIDGPNIRCNLQWVVKSILQRRLQFL